MTKLTSEQKVKLRKLWMEMCVKCEPLFDAIDATGEMTPEDEEFDRNTLWFAEQVVEIIPEQNKEEVSFGGGPRRFVSGNCWLEKHGKSFITLSFDDPLLIEEHDND